MICRTTILREARQLLESGRKRWSVPLSRAVIGLGIVCSAVAEVRAQGLPAEGADQEFLRQQERERVLRQQQEQSPSVRLQVSPSRMEPERLPAAESPCFRIEHILLGGDSVEGFHWALADANTSEDGTADAAAPRCLGSRGVNLVMRRIQNAILRRGYVTTRVLAEPQDLGSRTLRLTVIPGRIRSIRFAQDADARATRWNALSVAPGDLLNLRDIEQALENFKRIPSVEAGIQILPADEPDAKPGESDLVIAWKQGFPLRLSISVDDSGARATGKYQGRVTISYDHWWTLNDLFYLSFNRDVGESDPDLRGTKGYSAHYSLPLGYWLLGLNAGSNRYHQTVAGANQAYRYSGDSENSDIELSHVAYRDAQRRTTLSMRGWARASRNFIDDTEVQVQRRRMAGWELGIGHREFIGSAVLDVNLSYRRGTGAMNALPAPEENFGEGTARPEIIRADAQLTVPWALGTQRLLYGGTWRAQWNRTPLVPQDRFAIGGRYTIRGFDGENLLSSDRGWLMRNDLGLALGQTGQELYLGIDFGKVGGPGSRALVGTCLSGVVLGLRGGYGGASYDIFIGSPIGKPAGFKTASMVAGFNLSWTS